MKPPSPASCRTVGEVDPGSADPAPVVNTGSAISCFCAAGFRRNPHTDVLGPISTRQALVQALLDFQNRPASLRRCHKATAPCAGRLPPTPPSTSRLDRPLHAPSPALSDSVTAIQNLAGVPLRSTNWSSQGDRSLPAAKPLLELLWQAQQVHPGRQILGYPGPAGFLLSVKHRRLRRRLPPYCPQSMHHKRRLSAVARRLRMEPVLGAGPALPRPPGAIALHAAGFARNIRDGGPLRAHAPPWWPGCGPWGPGGLRHPAGMPHEPAGRTWLPAPHGLITTTSDTKPGVLRAGSPPARTYSGSALKPLARVARAGLTVCCGGIIGMGESRDTGPGRASCKVASPTSIPTPRSVPINGPGGRLEGTTPLEPTGNRSIRWELVRMVAHRSDADALFRDRVCRLSAGPAEKNKQPQRALRPRSSGAWAGGRGRFRDFF